jgi:hypothetical protein
MHAMCSGWIAMVAVFALAGCAGGGGKAAEEQHQKEHPCEFSATSKQCERQRSTEKRGEEARHETGALRERARLEAERARLRQESKSGQ